MNANLLIDELKGQPERFFSEGRTYDLLQEYFRGENIDSLLELLAHKDLSVRKSAIWIVSELGGDAAPIIDAILPLLNDDERYVKYYALESVMSCSCAGVKGIFHYITSALEDDDYVIRKLGMLLISNASSSQLEEVEQHYSESKDKFHAEGLKILNNNVTHINCSDQVNDDLYGEHNNLAMYKAITLKRYAQSTGHSVSFDLERIKDDATKRFLDEQEM